MKQSIKIGGASGYWGESSISTPQLLSTGDLDYLIYDYLAEITMSIMARAKAKNAGRGYATDFVEAAMRPHLLAIARQGVKVISNAGGMNPMACANALRAIIKAQGLDLKVGVVTGDDLMIEHAAYGSVFNSVIDDPEDMDSGARFDDREDVASANVYLGAFPIARALDKGADIVITGRCVDSALTLGACIHEFRVPDTREDVFEGHDGDGDPYYSAPPDPVPGDTLFPWSPFDFDALASGSLAGHILECGPQATGGNFTDWDSVSDIAHIGYPIAEIRRDGSFTVTKPKATGGLVSVGTVSEQMLYEIGDPRAYALPDVVCDFSGVKISQAGDNTVHVSPAKGRHPTDDYKTSLTYLDGYRGGQYMTLYGGRADEKARVLTDAILTRSRDRLRALQMPDFTQISQDIIGASSQSGQSVAADEVVLKLAVKHEDAQGVAIFLKEMAGIGLATPPGLSGFTGAGRASPSPVLRLMSFMTPKFHINITVDVDGETEAFHPKRFDHELAHLSPATAPDAPNEPANSPVPLRALAWGRSGDKGDKANIGIIARDASYMPYIWAALTKPMIAHTLAHFMDNESQIERYYLPGAHAMNILITHVLGGGGPASLRNDAQGKGFAQLLLNQMVDVPAHIAETLY
ncbi:acyclic terpene utilization AtuA family protein [Fretibacter rubidus]|uniref:acyclic terpene utilization AtuA family protein n=1 Tax=Fretibacter rubidus TaxID=570162 RepID=UPI003529DFC8